MKQGEQAWLLTGDGGNHEYARLFWCETKRDTDAGTGPRYRVGQGGDAKLGGNALISVNCDERGAHLVWSNGRQSFLPVTWYQLSWSH